MKMKLAALLFIPLFLYSCSKKNGSAMQGADDEYSIGWNILRGSENPEECVEWFKKAAMHGDVAAQMKLGELYETGTGCIVNDYAEARRWYEMAAANGCDDDDVTDALERLPPIDDYPALFAMAIDNEIFGPNFPLAFVYAIKGGFADADFDNPACESMLVHYPIGCGKTAMRALCDLACEQMVQWKENGFKIADEYVAFYRANANDGGENLSYLLVSSGGDL